ncbi:liver-expressed antimicrobial peptide 2 [Cynoglossus semilaevis]|uniref:liver-expressed antimicrobial peptide 2 n=1 Tax=Cynoglossus semilaevis TaxID=244447 RepID=UPI0004983A1D|nr:liver-expressed antimicrobial peptide 2 [Cynoglossus semilaevis]
MQLTTVCSPRGSAAVFLILVLLTWSQQVSSGPLASETKSSPDLGLDSRPQVHRVARMTPLWRILNSKPFGAYCQNNYECSTGICRAGHCSAIQRSQSGAVKS